MPERPNGNIKADREKQHGLHGYNELALRSAIMMAGYKYPAPSIARITGLNVTTARLKLANGEWSRNNISRMIVAFHFTPEQVMDIFFTGGGIEPTPEEKKEWQHMKDLGKPNLAAQLDSMLRGLTEE